MALTLGCACDSGNGNTGLPNCQDLFGLASGLALQNIVAKDGTLNRINLAVASITTEWSSLLTQADKTKRIYPILGLKNVDFPLEDTQFETDNTNQKERIREGIQSFTGEKWKVSNVFVNKVKQSICPRNGVWIYTKEGVIGVKKSDGYLYPIEINALDAKYGFLKGDAVNKMMLSFDFDVDVEIGELWQVKWADLNSSLAAQTGLQDANFEQIDAPATGGGNTTVGLRLTTDYGQGLLNNQTIDGLVTANFTVTSNGIAVAGLAVTEVADNKYTISYTSETPGDAIKISLALTTGYEGSFSYVEPA